MSFKQKVLIIDDEVDFCTVFKSYLSKKGCDVHIANSLASGFTMMESLKPDVVFLDNNLPDGSGWEKIDFINKTYPAVRINLISAYKQNVDMSTNNQINIWEKPLDLQQLDSYFQQQSTNFA